MSVKDASDASSRLDYLGYTIALTGAVPEQPDRQPLLLRMLAASSPLGMQEAVWEWSVLQDAVVVASGHELSKPAALEAARYWIGSRASGGGA